MLKQSVANPFRFMPGRSRRALMWPAGITSLAARWSSKDSTITTARDGTGSAPADAGLVGRVLDLSGNGHYLTASADGARATWYANGMGLDRASIYSANTSHDLYNQSTGLAASFSGTNPSFTVSLLTARRIETRGSNAYIFGVLKNGGSIGASSGNPAFTINPQNGVFSASRPWIVSGYARDNDTSLQSGQVFDDTPASGIGYGSSSIICYTLVKSGQTSNVYQNGHLVSTATQSSGDFTFGSDAYISFLKTYNGTTRTGLLDGHLYEACVYSKALSDAERQAVEAYYLGLVGVTYSTATVTTPKAWWFIGHSMFATNVATIPTAPFLIARGSRIPWDEKIKIVNRAVSSQRIVAAGADNDSSEVWTYTGTTATTVKSGDTIVLRGATNEVPPADDTNNGTMEADMVTSLGQYKTVIDDMITETDRVIFVADPPRSDVGIGTVEKYGVSYFRDIARTLVGRYDRVAFVDSFAAFTDGSNGLLAAYDSGDGLHLNKAGYEIEADSIASAATHLRNCNPKDHANLIRWYSGRGQDTTLADAAAMAAIVDLSNAGVNAAQATAGNKPTFRLGTSASNYKATVRFDTSDDFMTFTAVNLAVWTLIICVKTNADDARILHDEAGGNGYFRLTDTTTTRVRAGAGNVVRFTHAARGDYDVLVITSDARMWINGTAATVSDAEGTSFTANFVADQLGRAANPFAGELGDVMIYDAALSTADVNQQAKYIAEKYGKTWATVT